jgi:hypothetical protein
MLERMRRVRLKNLTLEISMGDDHKYCKAMESSLKEVFCPILREGGELILIEEEDRPYW